ncbi:MAG: 1,4-alpha-glucan branching protein GlgB [Gammaproteobacteria bacterium]
MLGRQRTADGAALLRTFRPGVDAVEVLAAGSDRALAEMRRIGDTDVFEAELRQAPAAYRLAVRRGSRVDVVRDAYEFHDGGLFDALGDRYRLWKYLGSHLREMRDDGGGSVPGLLFRVYAPRARSVSVVGDFNAWDGRVHPMQSGSDGIWRLFIPDLGEGTLYKYEVRAPDGTLLPLKSDPCGFYQEQATANATIAYDHGRRDWRDEEWMTARARRDPQSTAMTIYEVHLGSWRRHDDAMPDYRRLADELVPYVVSMGFTHVELLPVTEHPYYGSWGYQPTALFAPTSRYGSPDDFKYFVESCHRAEIGVILDWVPAHFPDDPNGLARFDGTPLYEHPDPRRGWHPDWQTLIYDFGRPYVRDFLISNALYWISEFHVDGLRVDAVASMLYLDYSREPGEWEPNRYGGNENLEAVEFIRELNVTVHREFPDVMVAAEESTAWPKVSFPTREGGLGFGFKWNMGWMHDTLRYFGRDPVHRRHHHHEMTFSLMYAWSEHFVLPLSHDEVVHGKGSLIGKMAGDDWQKFANLRCLYAWMYSHPGRKLLFMGSELAPWQEWNHERGLDWDLARQPRHGGVRALIRRLNRLYHNEGALSALDFSPDGFRWLDADDAEHSILAYRRCAPEGGVVNVVLNLTPVVRDGYRLGVDREGTWRVLLNTDAGEFGGSDAGSGPEASLVADGPPVQGCPRSITVTLPPLGALFLVPAS